MTMAFDAQGETSNEVLMVLYANGDRHAALALAQRVTPRVLAYAARLLSGDRAEAEDVAQETMLRLWRVAPEWRQGETKVTTWAYRVATNLCIDRQRARGRRRQMALDDAPEVADAAPGAEGRLQEAGRMAALEAALAELP
ncbi:MAG: sigma-70 family RNA polymerase sigma factor, partial [Acetobacteraceae bacterium]